MRTGINYEAGIYQIKVSTNYWQANRDRRFKRGCNYYIDDSGLTLEMAQKRLLELFNIKYDTYFSNWGTAVISTWGKAFCAHPTRDDSTRVFEYDGYTYEIEEMIIEGDDFNDEE